MRHHFSDPLDRDGDCWIITLNTISRLTAHLIGTSRWRFR